MKSPTLIFKKFIFMFKSHHKPEKSLTTKIKNEGLIFKNATNILKNCQQNLDLDKCNRVLEKPPISKEKRP